MDERTDASDDRLRPGWRDRPHPSRLAANHPHFDEIVERHRRSLETGIPNYADPSSGLRVFTAGFLAARGDCCESGCRHCPFIT